MLEKPHNPLSGENDVESGNDVSQSEENSQDSNCTMSKPDSLMDDLEDNLPTPDAIRNKMPKLVVSPELILRIIKICYVFVALILLCWSGYYLITPMKAQSWDSETATAQTVSCYNKSQKGGRNLVCYGDIIYAHNGNEYHSNVRYPQNTVKVNDKLEIRVNPGNIGKPYIIPEKPYEQSIVSGISLIILTVVFVCFLQFCNRNKKRRKEDHELVK